PITTSEKCVVGAAASWLHGFMASHGFTAYVSLKHARLMLYSTILLVMLRRDSPHSLAQRPTLPCVFLSALRMYCCSMLATASRSRSGKGRFRSIWNGVRGEAGADSSAGRFSGKITFSRDVTHARSIAFSSSRMLPGHQ